MKARPKPEYLRSDHGQRDRWLLSYTDIVTLLLILFVAMAAQGVHSAAAPPQPKSAAPAPPNPVPTLAPLKSGEMHPALARADEQLRSRGIDAKLEKRGLVISLPQSILFPSGADAIAPEALPVVSQVADVLASVPNKIALVGHADSSPINNKRFHNNWELSAARGLSLLRLLRYRYGIAESRLSVQSFGSNDPKNTNDTPSGRAENRRVEILLLDESSD